MTPDPHHIAASTRLDPVCEHYGPAGYCRRLSVSAVVVAGGSPSNLTDYKARCDIHALPDAPRFCSSCHAPNDSDGLTCRPCTERSEWQPATHRTQGGNPR